MIQKISLLFYIALSLYGAAWISDEFDYARASLYGLFLIPVMILYWGSLYFDSQWLISTPLCIAVCWEDCLWATYGEIFYFVNAFTSKSREKVHHLFKEDTTDRSLLAGRSRGGLGWLYRTRW